MEPLFIPEGQTHKSSLPSSIKSISFSSPKSKFSGCLRGISWSKDHNFYFNFQELKNPMHETSKRSQLILESIGCEKIWGKKQMGHPKIDLDSDNDEACNWFVNIHPELFDMKQRIKEQRLIKISDDDKFLLVNVNKNQFTEKEEKSNCNMRANFSNVKVDSTSRDNMAMETQRAKMSFHIASIPKPQDVYRIQVNNVNQPFQHVWLERSADGSRLIHPLEKLSVSDFVDKNVSNNELVKPPPVEITPFKLVQDVKELKALVARLQDANEIAVDLEHNQYRSFQGLTCLMQISTRKEDFIVDTLKLRVQIGPYLKGIFKDPTKRKVMHGADKDILWLQRDFGIYVCNMFDTGQASRVLKMERNSLDYLLRYFCGITANKEYQTADWRFRPLTDEMLRYAREDTHYLLHIYDLMKIKLLSSSDDPECPESLLHEVYQRSYNVCMQLYQKDITNEYSYLNIYGLNAADLNGQQLSIVAALYEWRDVIARAEDESTGYILPNRSLIEIAKEMPGTTEELCRILKFRNPHIERNLVSIVSIVQNSFRNAYAFEAVARRLKQERLQMEASVNLVGSSNIVTNQFGQNTTTKMKFVPDNKAIEGPNPEKFTRKVEPQHVATKGRVTVQEPPKCKKPNSSSFKPMQGVILRELGSSVTEGEDEKNLTYPTSSIKKVFADLKKDKNVTS